MDREAKRETTQPCFFFGLRLLWTGRVKGKPPNRFFLGLRLLWTGRVKGKPPNLYFFWWGASPTMDREAKRETTQPVFVWASYYGRFPYRQEPPRSVIDLSLIGGGTCTRVKVNGTASVKGGV